MASDTSLLFNILGRDGVSQVFAKIRAEAAATSAVMGEVGRGSAVGLGYASKAIAGCPTASPCPRSRRKPTRVC